MPQVERSGDFGASSIITRAWPGIRLQAHEQSLGPGKAWHKFVTAEPIVSVVLDEMGGTCETRIDLKTRSQRPANLGARGHMSIIPRGSDVWGYTEGVSLVREARFFVDPRGAAPAQADDFSSTILDTPRLMEVDHEIQTIARLLFAESKREATASLYGEGLVVALLSRLGSRDTSTGRKRSTGGLTPRQLRQVRDYVEAFVTDSITLAQLADLVGLSRSQFGRAFKTSTGMSPHQWHLDRRLKYAKDLLRTDQPLVDVALAAGFSEQSHFNRVFRSFTGTTPGAWRKSV